MASFKKKEPVVNEDIILSNYVALVAEAKALEKKIEPMKTVVLGIVDSRGGEVRVGDTTVKKESRSTWTYPADIQVLVEKQACQQALIDAKMKHAQENKTAIETKKFHVVVRKASKEE